ncbi:MAG: toll/interleukin-1 receptor domain-containing protein [Anaerolineaceae bacterium]|nr:toll/interleukin-1 receptor domain-containing protein [Anaerolineaceae bacterium]
MSSICDGGHLYFLFAARADTFLFIISPHAIASPVCNLEINYALLNNKRLIIPVVHISTDEKAAFAIIGIAIPFVVTLISALLIFYFTLQEWGGTMATGPDSLAGMPGILSAWMGGCSSGFVILSIRYLIMRSPKNKLT